MLVGEPSDIYDTEGTHILYMLLMSSLRSLLYIGYRRYPYTRHDVSHIEF